LGFAADGVYVATGSHAYRVELSTPSPRPWLILLRLGRQQRASSASRHLPQLVPGITLAYDAPDGTLLRSTYRLDPLADPAHIRLRYKHTVQVESDGALALNYATGVMRESAPIAWQEIGGQRLPLRFPLHWPPALRWEKGKDDVVGFALGTYNPAYPLYIDPSLTWQHLPRRKRR